MKERCIYEGEDVFMKRRCVYEGEDVFMKGRCIYEEEDVFSSQTYTNSGNFERKIKRNV